MAGDTEVIRQFLVSLGFQVDQNGLKKFVGGLGATNNAAMLAGKAVLGVAVAAEAMVIQFSSSMEKLYYQSKRTNSTVENLQGLEFGSRKIGLAAGVARDALEGMVGAARMNPGLRGLIDGLLGKDTGGLDQSRVMLDLVQKLADMPHYAGAQYAQMFGMDEKTFLMLKDGLPELLKAEEERRGLNRQAGIDAQAAAEAGKEYANSIKDITERVSVLRDRLSIELLPAFREFNREIVTALDNATKFKLSEHPQLEGGVNTVVGAAKGVRESASDLFGGIGSLDAGRAWGGLKGVITNSPGGVAVRKGFGAINDWRDSYRPGGSRSDNPTAPPSQGPPVSPSGKQLPRGLRQNNPGNLRSWGNTPVVDGFANFGTAGEGLSAMAGNLLAYQRKHGLNNVRDIIARWAPKKDKNDTGAYIDAVSQRLGVGAGDELNLKDPAVLSKLMGAIVQHENGYNPYGTAELMAAAQSRLGNGGAGKQVVIHSKTDIHVNGADSPAETGRSVAMVQDQVTGNMVRNMQGAIQ